MITWNEIVYGLGDIFEATFAILPPLGNIPNILFALVIVGGLVYWVMQLKKYKDEADRTGGIE